MVQNTKYMQMLHACTCIGVVQVIDAMTIELHKVLGLG